MVFTPPGGAGTCVCVCVWVYVCLPSVTFSAVIRPLLCLVLLPPFKLKWPWFFRFLFCWGWHLILCVCVCVCVCVCLGPHLQHMEVPRLGVESELQLLAYTTATAIPDPSGVCDLHYSSWQRRILNPLSKDRDRTCNLMVPSQIRFCWATTGTLTLGF